MRFRIRNPETKSFLIFCGDWGVRQTKSLIWLKVLRGGRTSLRTKGAVRSVYVRIPVLEAAPGIDIHKKYFPLFNPSISITSQAVLGIRDTLAWIRIHTSGFSEDAKKFFFFIFFSHNLRTLYSVLKI
jgi:hypothetical protein